MQLIIDIPNSKVSFAQEVLKNLSFIKGVKPLPTKNSKEKKAHFSDFELDTPNYKFDREEANAR